VPSAKTPTALLSLSDRRGIEPLAGALRRFGYRLVATAGTAKAIRAFNLACEEVGELTGFGALLDGRVKTLHPKIMAGILAEPNKPEHMAELDRYEIPVISVVAANLYPFEQAAARGDTSHADVIEHIDIGGVTLLRAAAKNYAWVSVLASPDHYDEFIDALDTGGPTLEQRQKWALEAFQSCERYDQAIARYFARSGEGAAPGAPRNDTVRLEVPAAPPTRLRYGENPWARASFYPGDAASGARMPVQLSGKDLSYNNLLDVDSALKLLTRLAPPAGFDPAAVSRRATTAAIVKHTVPCGVAARDSTVEALAAALGADPISAFGGVVACSAQVDQPAATILKARFLEVVAAPDFDREALATLSAKKNLRILRFDPALPQRLIAAPKIRSALGGLLVEEPDPAAEPDAWEVVTDTRPAIEQWRDLLFAFGVVRHVKSNAAVVVRDEVAIGICGGQTNRVSAVALACERAGDAVKGAVLATDGFFPFADGVEAAARAGIAAIVAPRGSIRDEEVIAAARASGVALVFTTRRYFLH
jgi:phosphoribosylaminoimidazolecarboxamide formyltransferase / IMP cyclohydrolase